MGSPEQLQRNEVNILVEQAHAGDLEAFNQLVLQYQDLAYFQAYTLLGDPEAAADTVQESFIKAYQAIHSFRGGSFRNWLFAIVTNQAYDLMRRLQRHPVQSLYPVDENGDEIESAPWLADPSASVEDAVEKDELSSLIYGLLDRLSPAKRSVLVLVDIHELDYTEAAAVLGVPVGTIKSRLARARLQMQAELAKYVDFRAKTGSAVAQAVGRAISIPL